MDGSRETTRVRRAAGLAALVACLSVAGAVGAESRALCVTDVGWCALAEPGAGAAEACICETADETIAGRILAIDTPNPFLELKTPTEGRATRALPTIVSATRGFSGPTQFPPQEFSAYGILAFKRRASSFDRDRHLMICEAYLSALPHTSEVGTAPANQMVTIWPIETDSMADRLNAADRNSACEDAVEHYGLVQSQNAIRILERYSAAVGSYDLSARGPLLIAWAPTQKILEPGSAALVVDLSEADTYEEVVLWLDRWRDKIQNDQEMWDGGFDETAGWDKLVGILRDFFDENGTLVRFGE